MPVELEAASIQIFRKLVCIFRIAPQGFSLMLASVGQSCYPHLSPEKTLSRACAKALPLARRTGIAPSLLTRRELKAAQSFRINERSSRLFKFR
jgi:hypothetical protein